jgi:glycerophosphoryl diester phosphodiesterase
MTLELDVGLAKDGVLVVYHDRWLNPAFTRGADGAYVSGRGPLIRSLTVEELKRYDVGRLDPNAPYAKGFPDQRPADGERIPTLTEVFALAAAAGAGHVRFNIETKLSPNAPNDTADPDTFAAALAKALREAGLSARASVQSFDWRTLMTMQRIAPEIERVCLTAQMPNFDTIQRGKSGPSPFTADLDVDDHDGSTPKLVAAAGCAVWSPSFRDISPEWLAEAKALNLKTIPWTVNAPADMERLIDMGVDGIITDYPDRLRAVMAAKGMPLPPPVTVK